MTPRRAPSGPSARRLALALTLLLPCAAAGQSPRVRPATAAGDDLVVHVLDRHLGLPVSGVYAVVEGADGRLWAGLEDGLIVEERGSWRRVALAPGAAPGAAHDQVRSLAAMPDGTIWAGTRGRVIRLTRGGEATAFAIGPAERPVYSLAVTRAIDGTPRMVAGTFDAVLWFDGTRWLPLAHPPELAGVGAMVTADEAPGQPPALWLGSIRGGVGRLAGGRWTRWAAADGLDEDVQHVVPAPAGSRWRAVAATGAGVYALPVAAARWQRVLAATSMATRVAATPRALDDGGAISIWAGTSNGDLYRVRESGAVDTIPVLAGGARTSIFALLPTRDADGRVVMHVGYRGGVMARVSEEWASAMPTGALGMGVPAHAVGVDPADGVVWAFASVGLIPLDAPGAAPQRLEEENTGNRLVVEWPDAPDGPALAALMPGRAWIRQRGRWRTLPAPPAADVIAATVAVAPEGTVRTLVLQVPDGTWYLEGGGWRRWPGTPRRIGALLGPPPGERTLWAAAAGGEMHRWDGRGWQRMRAPQTDEPRSPRALRRVRLADGGRGIWAVMDQGELALADEAAPGTWRTVRLQAFGQQQEFYHDLVQDATGRLHLATAGGIVTMRPGPRPADPPRVLLTLTEDDGLPHPRVGRLAVDRTGHVWATTAAGMGRFDGALADRPAAPAALVLEAWGIDGAPIASGAEVPWSRRQLDVRAALDVRHREADTRYRIAVDGAPASELPWRADPALSLRALGAGAHTVRAWARDWRGRVLGPATFRLHVAPPAWRSAPALAAAALAFVALVVAAERLRTRALRRRAAESEASERRLASSEQRFRALFDRGTEPQLLVRDDWIVEANDAAVALLARGRGREALTGRAVASLLAPGEEREAPLLAAGSPDADSALRELQVLAHDGSVIPVTVRALRLQLGDEALVHVALHDLRAERRLAAERAALEDQLRQSQRLEALGTLASGVAHDFNNLLAIVRTNAELAREEAGTAVGSELDAILSASDRARDLVRQILAFGRRSRSTFVPLVPGMLLRDFLPMLRATIPATVRMSLVDESGEAMVLGDSTQLHQMLLNLCANAEYAMRSMGGGTLALHLDAITHPADPTLVAHPTLPVGRYVRLRVADSGPGMDVLTQQRIFEPFFSTKPAGEGTGLGLSVLHGLVESHGGSVGVRSAPNAGTTFELLLPLLEAGVPADPVGDADVPAARIDRDAPGTSAAHVALVVDDEPYVGRVAARALERIGVACHVAEHPREALRILAAHDEVTLLLTDLTMPELRGDQLAREALRLRPDLAVVVMTGLAARLAPEDGRAAGVHAVVDKPFSTAELQRAVHAALAARDGRAAPDARTSAVPTATA